MNVSNITQSMLYSTTSQLGVFQRTSSASSGYEGIQSAGTLITQDDENEDELLTINDTPLPEDMFNVADEDGDGYLSQEEFEAYLESRPGTLEPSQGLAEMDAASILDSEDADSSGTLTFDETTLTEEMFATADSDGDEYISSEELEAYVASAPEGAGGMGAPPPGGMPPDEDDDEEDDTSITSANAFAIKAYQNVSSNFMNIMVGGSGAYTDDIFSNLVV
nr:EF-hand domain-containing protein [uncultured Desulfobacter sp.]